MTRADDKLRMTLVASICMIPSWIIVLVQNKFIPVLDNMGIDQYLFTAFHYAILFYVVFGLLPWKVFSKWGWTNNDHGYAYQPDATEVVLLNNSMKDMSLSQV